MVWGLRLIACIFATKTWLPACWRYSMHNHSYLLLFQWTLLLKFPYTLKTCKYFLCWICGFFLKTKTGKGRAWARSQDKGFSLCPAITTLPMNRSLLFTQLQQSHFSHQEMSQGETVHAMVLWLWHTLCYSGNICPLKPSSQSQKDCQMTSTFWNSSLSKLSAKSKLAKHHVYDLPVSVFPEGYSQWWG